MLAFLEKESKWFANLFSDNDDAWHRYWRRWREQRFIWIRIHFKGYKFVKNACFKEPPPPPVFRFNEKCLTILKELTQIMIEYNIFRGQGWIVKNNSHLFVGKRCFGVFGRDHTHAHRLLPLPLPPPATHR